ncbi:flippase [Mobilicoccus massiliensis]|uniref:flippase n=1 Tax=Mobilicoccus massiliensis TaxID=1522310 RepID=UPI0009E4745B|nr:flippase [Mobilicoccus massiliensis]
MASRPEKSHGGGLLRGLSNLVGARGLGILFTLVQVKISTNYLGTEGYGVLSAALVLIGTFEAFTELGIGTIVVRRVAAGADLHRTVGIAQALSFCLSVVLVLGAILAGWFGYRGTGAFEGILILSVGLFGTAWAATYNAVAQTRDDFAGISWADISGRVLSLLIVVIAVSSGAGIELFFVAQLAAPLTRGLVSHLWGRRHGPFRRVWSRREMTGLLREALPLTYITVIAGLYFQIDGVMIVQLSTVVQAGAYNFAYRIAMNVTVIGLALTSVLVARFATAAATSDESYRRVLRISMAVILSLCLPIAFLLWPFNADVIRLLGSEDFVEISSLPLTLLWVSTATSMAGMLVSTALVAGHTQRFLAYLNTCTLALNIALNALFIPRWAASGAAAALAVTEVLGLTLALIRLGRRCPGFWPWRDFLVLIGALALALGVEYVTAPVLPWVVRGVVVAATFFLVAYLSGVVTPTKLRELSEGPSHP